MRIEAVQVLKTEIIAEIFLDEEDYQAIWDRSALNAGNPPFDEPTAMVCYNYREHDFNDFLIRPHQRYWGNHAVTSAIHVQIMHYGAVLMEDLMDAYKEKA